jgi:hypothetical protein
VKLERARTQAMCRSADTPQLVSDA